MNKTKDKAPVEPAIEVIEPEIIKTQYPTRFTKDDPRRYTGPKKPARRRKALPDLPDLLAEILGEKQGGKTAARLILAALRKRAVAGDVRAAEVLLDRAYGKAPQEINVNKTERQVILLGGQKLEF